MRAATAGATAILILVTEVWACAAGAEDAIKPGKWEFWTVGAKIPEPPPGTQLPPSMRWGPEGMNEGRSRLRPPTPPSTRCHAHDSAEASIEGGKIVESCLVSDCRN